MIGYKKTKSPPFVVNPTQNPSALAAWLIVSIIKKTSIALKLGAAA
jgi:hypothetical protein